MKNPRLIPVAALALLMMTGCERKTAETTKQLEELRRKADEATARQKQLEQELADQRLAADRNALERDRMQLEKDRVALEQQQGDEAAAKAEEIRKREEALASREGHLEQIQADLEEKKSDLANTGAKLNERERELAGREALPFQQQEPQEPVGDYGIFYDQLSRYGSWFETADYGYVWQPVVVSDSNWRPYCRGRWVCTDRGWTWVSDEPFGWATYHYGRWALVRGRGWVWVPGSEWAPCWVSWRHGGSRIGWAPLPPETLAYRNHRWDSSVDVQFGIGASWYNFVEYRNFGGSLYQHCLPVSQNISFFSETTNITYIHVENRQVICGGPRYKDVCDRVGRPVPFCRLEIDSHPRPNGSVIGTRPQISGDRLRVLAPNVAVEWNEGLRPKQIKGRMDGVVVERNEPLRPEIADRYRKNREESTRIANRSIEEMGGAEQFPQRRVERLEENRKQVANSSGNPDKGREVVKNPDRPQREELPNSGQKGPVAERPIVAPPEQVENPPVGNRPSKLDRNDPLRPGIGTPGVYPREGLRPQPLPAGVSKGKDVAESSKEPTQQPQQPRDDRQERLQQQQERQRQINDAREEVQRKTEEQQRQVGRQRQQEQARQQQEENQSQQEQTRKEEGQRQAENSRRQMIEQQREQAKQNQEEQARQAREEAKQQKLEEARQRQQEQARQAQEAARQQQQEQMRQRQQEQARQAQEQARQEQQERARQQQEEQQQREMQRQQERARQQQEEQQQERNRQQQQEQEQARQQQEQSRQQQQEQNRRQQQEKNDQDQQEQSRKRNR